MFKVECKLYNIKKKDDDINWRGTSGSQDKKSQSPLKYSKSGYLPLAQYNLFSPGDEPEGTSLVLLKEPINGKSIHDNFGPQEKPTKFLKTAGQYMKTYKTDLVYQPLTK